MEFSKKNKKVAREVIEKGLQTEFANGLKKAQKVIETWKENKKENREAYHLLFSTVYDFDKHIADRYDGMSGSKYFYTIVEQFADGIITEDDLKDFSPEVREKIISMKQLREDD